jgi:hypothetical protein
MQLAATRRQSWPLVVALASLIGRSIEWYDFYIFGSAAALVFPSLFFPAAPPSATKARILAGGRRVGTR